MKTVLWIYLGGLIIFVIALLVLMLLIYMHMQQTKKKAKDPLESYAQIHMYKLEIKDSRLLIKDLAIGILYCFVWPVAIPLIVWKMLRG